TSQLQTHLHRRSGPVNSRLIYTGGQHQSTPDSSTQEEHRVYTELRKKGCRNLGGLCISKSKACPDDLPLDMVPGRPYCNRRHRCCHPVPTVDQCNGEYGFCIDKGDLCNGTVAEFYTSRNDHCTC
ncbi:unnamed protein product, partial [Meganyctiphanes norvegica]